MRVKCWLYRELTAGRKEFLAVHMPHPAATETESLSPAQQVCKGGKLMFKESLDEFKNLRNLTTAAMFAAISVIMGYFTVQIGDYLKIGFSSLVNQMVYYMFGPVFGGFFGGALDILKFIVKPTGEFFPGWTLGAMTAGVIYGCFFYKKKITLVRVLAAEFTVALICNVLLGTLWLSLMYGKGFMILAPMRAWKNLIMWPVNSMIFYTAWKSLEASGLFRMIRRNGFSRTVQGTSGMKNSNYNEKGK